MTFSLFEHVGGVAIALVVGLAIGGRVAWVRARRCVLRLVELELEKLRRRGVEDLVREFKAGAGVRR